MEKLHEIIAENHKALVFSQFTSLLSLVRDRLDDEDIRYEYLDGQTSDRQARRAIPERRDIASVPH
jgi:SNF2 family DNA or RNA helicase